MSRFDELARLKKLEAEATPGPWSWYAEDASMCWLGQTGNDQENFVLGSQACKACAQREQRCLQPRECDSRLISELRNAAPWLLKIAEAFRPGDATLLMSMAATVSAWPTYGPEYACLRRLQAVAEEMER